MINKNKIKVILSITVAFFLVFLISKGKEELTPKIFARKLINFLPKNIAKMIYQGKKSPTFTTVVLSKEKLEKVKLYYNNEEFEVYVDPNIELTQKKIKFLYYYWKLMNKKR